MKVFIRIVFLLALSFNAEASWFNKGLTAIAVPNNLSKKTPGFIGVTFHVHSNCTPTVEMYGTKKLLQKHIPLFANTVNVTAIVDGQSVSGEFTVKEMKLGDLAPGGKYDKTPMIYMYALLHNNLLSRLMAGKALTLVIGDSRYPTSLDGFTEAISNAYTACQNF